MDMHSNSKGDNNRLDTHARNVEQGVGAANGGSGERTSTETNET